MILRKLILFVLLATVAYGADPLFVSLGSSCEVAHQLRRFHLRQAAYPFDWILSIDNTGLISILKDDFADFFNRDFLHLHGNMPIHTGYSLVFPHEGNWDFFDAAYELFTSKFHRRIERFRAITDHSGTVFFIRAAWPWAGSEEALFRDTGNFHITDEYARELWSTLKQRFPSTDFVLVIMNLCENEEAVLRQISEGIVEVVHNPFLPLGPRLELCKNTFNKLLEAHHFPKMADER